MLQANNRFGRDEKLKSRKAIHTLFSGGNRISHFPFRGLWHTISDDPNIRVAVSVSSRNFKKAVHRNRIKRIMREAYRLNKGLLIVNEKEKRGLHVMIIYTGIEMPEFSDVEKQIKGLLKKISAGINESS